MSNKKELPVVGVVNGITYYRLSGAQTAAVLLMILFVYVNGLATPAIASIAMAFPSVDIALIQQVASLPALTSVIGSFIVGPLARAIPQKILFIVTMLIVLISGILPGLISDFTFMMICRGLIGIGTGMALTLALAFVPALFAPGAQRERIFGLGASVGAVCGILFQLLGGFLATMNWAYVFIGTLVTIPFIFYIWVVLPEPGKTKADSRAGNSKGAMKGFSATTWVLIILSFITPVFFFAFMTNMALAIAGQGLGDPAITGTVMAVYLVGAAVNGVLVPVLKKILKGFYLAMAFILFSVSLALLIFFPNLTMYFVAAFVFGLGFGMYNVEFGVRIAASCAPQSATMAMSFFTGVGGVSQFLSPLILAPLAAMLGLNSPVGQWQIAMPCMIVLAVIVILIQLFWWRKQAPVNMTEQMGPQDETADRSSYEA